MNPYTSATLQAYAHGLITTLNFAAALGWTVEGGSYTEIERDTLMALGLDAPEAATSTLAIRHVRAALEVFLWRRVVQALITSYDVTIGGDSFKRSQLFQAAQTALSMAEATAQGLGIELPPSGIGQTFMPPVEITGTNTQSPYTAVPYWERSGDPEHDQWG